MQVFLYALVRCIADFGRSRHQRDSTGCQGPTRFSQIGIQFQRHDELVAGGIAFAHFEEQESEVVQGRRKGWLQVQRSLKGFSGVPAPTQAAQGDAAVVQGGWKARKDGQRLIGVLKGRGILPQCKQCMRTIIQCVGVCRFCGEHAVKARDRLRILSERVEAFPAVAMERRMSGMERQCSIVVIEGCPGIADLHQHGRVVAQYRCGGRGKRECKRHRCNGVVFSS